MAKKRIKIPLSQHWNHFRQAVLPFICFFGCVVLTVWLWQRQGTRGNLIGEVERITADATAAVDGLLLPPSGPILRDSTGNPVTSDYWKILDKVTEGQVIAQLDSSVLQAEKEVLKQKTNQLRLEIAATQNRLKVQLESLKQNYRDLTQQRKLEYDRAYIAAKQIEVTIEQDRLEILRINARYQFLKNAKEKAAGSVAQRELVDLRKEAEVLLGRRQKNKYLREQLQTVLKNADDRLKVANEQAPDYPDIETAVEAIKASSLVLTAEMERVDKQIALLSIRAPMDGVITAINYYPGSAVRAGESIVTVSKERPEFIVGYWREKTSTRPQPGMNVGIRLPQSGSPEFTGQIKTVGPEVTEVPVHQLKDPATLEYGTIVKIPIPPELSTVAPGTLVHIIVNRKDLFATK